jgi:hypothetical protein
MMAPFEEITYTYPISGVPGNDVISVERSPFQNLWQDTVGFPFSIHFARKG